ncbi:MAG: hypothetical protein ACLT9P_01475 [Evtepia gabavorous]
MNESGGKKVLQDLSMTPLHHLPLRSSVAPSLCTMARKHAPVCVTEDCGGPQAG